MMSWNSRSSSAASCSVMPCFHQLGNPVDDALQLGDVLVRRIGHAALDRQTLDRHPERVDLVEIFPRELGDERAAVPADDDQPFALELGQRFPDGPRLTPMVWASCSSGKPLTGPNSR